MRDYAEPPVDDAREEPMREEPTREEPTREEPTREDARWERDRADGTDPADQAEGEAAAGGAQPLPPEPVVANAIPLEGTGVAMGMHEEPTAVVPVQPQATDQPGTGTDSAELKPGEADPVPTGAVWDDDARRDLRERWREVQLGFVDDPTATVGEARVLVDEAVDRYTAALAARRQELDTWQSGSASDTEVLRSALRGYRDFLNTLLA